MNSWKIFLVLIIFLIYVVRLPGQNIKNSDYKTFKWKISDWKKSFFIDIPKKNLKNIMYFSGTAKSIAFSYSDSSSIHIMIDPASFDGLNRNFIYTYYAIAQKTMLACNIDLMKIDTILNSDTTYYSGYLCNGKLWKEKSYPKIKICYINITLDQIPIYDNSIDSFRPRRKRRKEL